MAYSFPDDFRTLVHCGDELRYDGEWSTFLSFAKLFRISGVNDALREFKIGRDSIGKIDFLLNDVEGRVPAPWKDKFKGTRDSWRSYGGDQVAAMNSSQPQVLARALMSLIYLRDWLNIYLAARPPAENDDEALPRDVPPDFFQPKIQIVPIVFLLRFRVNGEWKDTSEIWKNELSTNAALVKALSDAALFGLFEDDERAKKIVDDALGKNHRLSFGTAERLAKVLNEVGIDTNICAPNTKNQKMHASKHEVLDGARAIKHGQISQFAA